MKTQLKEAKKEIECLSDEKDELRGEVNILTAEVKVLSEAVLRADEDLLQMYADLAQARAYSFDNPDAILSISRTMHKMEKYIRVELDG